MNILMRFRAVGLNPSAAFLTIHFHALLRGGVESVSRFAVIFGMRALGRLMPPSLFAFTLKMCILMNVGGKVESAPHFAVNLNI